MSVGRHKCEILKIRKCQIICKKRTNGARVAGQAKRTLEPVFAKAESKGVDEADLSIWMSFN